METKGNAGATATAEPSADAAKPQTSGLMDSIAVEDPGAALETEAEVTEAPETTTETEAEGQAASKAGTEETPESEIEEGTLKEPVKEEDKPLLAGRFKTAMELEGAYESSSVEARRLHAETLSLRKENDELQEKIAQSEIAQEIGSFKELTEDELVALMESENPKDRLKAQRYITDERAHKDRKSSLEKERARAQRDGREKSEQIRQQIEKEFDYMKSTPAKYPQFSELVPIMSEVFDKMGGLLGGHPLASEFLYYAAFGLASQQKNARAAQSASQDKDKAKAQTLLKAKAAGSSGATHAGKAPASSGDDLDDDSFMNRMVSTRPKRFLEV